MKDAVTIVRTFVERINARDVDGLCALMTSDHALVDAMGTTFTGTENMRKAWSTYFSWFPDYMIRAEHYFCDGEQVAVFGRASGTYAPHGELRKENSWEIPAAWLATVRREQIAVWRVYADNQAVHKLMQQTPPPEKPHG